MDTESPDQPIAEARANLSELMASTRLLKRVYFLASRGRRQAAVVPVEIGEAVLAAGGVEQALKLLTQPASE